MNKPAGIAWLLLLMNLPFAVHADDKAYWDKKFERAAGYNGTYQVELLVKKMGEAAERLQKAVQLRHGEDIRGWANPGCTDKCLFAYSLPTADCEKLSREVVKMGDLRRLDYSNPRRVRDDDDLEARVEALRAELDSNAEALERMPAVWSIAKAKLGELEEVRASRRRADERCEFRITLSR